MHFRIFETWRLMAAILVMTYHFLRFGPGDAFQYDLSHVLERLLPLMDMFFMISGFLILLRYGDKLKDWSSYKSFIVRRLARFYPLYLLTLSFFVFVGVMLHLGLVSSTVPERYDYSILLQNILLLQAWGTTKELSFNYVSWSLSAEWFCYLLLPVYVLVIRLGGVKGLAVLAVISVILLEAATRAGIIPFESWLQADTWGAYRAFADFAIGGVVMLLARDSRLQLRSHAFAWALFALAMAAMMMLWPAYVIVGLLGVAMFAAAVVERNNPEGARFLSVLSPAGRVSFGIYLWHPVVETIILAIVWRHGIEPLGIMSFYQFLIVPMVASVIVAICSDRYFEKPVSERINRLFGWDRSARKAPVGAAAT
jgi:peptidoglycan/LPS O-acetylase OafA/YrhL